MFTIVSGSHGQIWRQSDVMLDTSLQMHSPEIRDHPQITNGDLHHQESSPTMSLSNHTAHPINNQQKETEIITTKGYANKVLTGDYCRYFRQVLQTFWGYN